VATAASSPFVPGFIAELKAIVPGKYRLWEPAKVLYVQPDAPREVVEAAYRALSKKYHPDRGGNEALMKQLNDAIVQAREAGW
jgi:preprotein translocase subunit Sec63